MWFQEKLFGVIIGPLWIFPTLGFLLLSWVPGLAGHLGEYWGSACGVPRFESQVGLGWGLPSALGCSCGLPAFRLSSLPSDSETSFLPSLPSPSCSSAAASEIPALSQALHRILLLKQTYQPRGRSDYCLHHDRSRNEPGEAGGRALTCHITQWWSRIWSHTHWLQNTCLLSLDMQMPRESGSRGTQEKCEHPTQPWRNPRPQERKDLSRPQILQYEIDSMARFPTPTCSPHIRAAVSSLLLYWPL